MPADYVDSFAASIAAELRRRAARDEEESRTRRAAIMALVRASGPHARRPSARRASYRVSPAVGFALAAGLAALMTLRPVGASGAAALTSGASVTAVTIRDTLRLVRFMLVAPHASRVAVAGDFNGWNRSATQLAESAGVWRAQVALPPGEHRYSFIVEDQQWAADMSAVRVPPSADSAGRMQ